MSVSTKDTTSLTTETSGTYKSNYGECPKLTHVNYEEWSSDMSNFLEAADSLSIVKGDEPSPGALNTAAARDYRKRFATAKAMIQSSCTKSTRVYIRS